VTGAVLSYAFILQQNAHACFPLPAPTAIFKCQQVSRGILEHLYILKNNTQSFVKKDKEWHEGGCALVQFRSARLRRLHTHFFGPI
jgi:hypothetical protein